MTKFGAVTIKEYLKQYNEAVENAPESFDYLDDTDRKIVDMRYGDGLTFEDIGKKLGLSRQRAAERERRGMNVLRVYQGVPIVERIKRKRHLL